MTKILSISFRIIVVATVAVLAYTALSRGLPAGITFALEDDLNLTIDSAAFWNGIPVPGSTWELKDLVPGVDKFFDLDGLMPGDRGSATISMHVESRASSAWLCLDFTNLESNENGVNEPESHEDTNGEESGELADGLNVFAWYDDGDNVFEGSIGGEQWIFGPHLASSVFNDMTFAIADASTTPPVASGDTRFVGLLWCAGDMVVNIATGETTCMATGLENDAQTDSLSVDIAIRAVAERGREGFLCDGGTLPDGRERPDRPNFERPERPEFERPLRDTRELFVRPDRPDLDRQAR